MTRDIEHKHQAALIRWSNIKALTDWRFGLLYAIPNAGKRSRFMAARAKAEGLRAGMPDLCLPIHTKNYGALYIEMKERVAGRLESHQQVMHRMLRESGNYVIVCMSWDDAKSAIEEYLA
jgi:hypothetical protein